MDFSFGCLGFKHNVNVTVIVIFFPNNQQSHRNLLLVFFPPFETLSLTVKVVTKPALYV